MSIALDNSQESAIIRLAAHTNTAPGTKSTRQAVIQVSDGAVQFGYGPEQAAETFTRQVTTQPYSQSHSNEFGN